MLSEKKKYIVYCQQQWAMPIVWYGHSCGILCSVYVYRMEHISFLFFSIHETISQKDLLFKMNWTRFFQHLTVSSRSIISFKAINEIRTILLAICFCSYINWLFVWFFFLLYILFCCKQLNNELPKRDKILIHGWFWFIIYTNKQNTFAQSNHLKWIKLNFFPELEK